MSEQNVVGEEIKKVMKLLWGNSVQEDTFKRWSQGFVFSTDEPTALVQFQGGPCAVIAPVQAYIVKEIILARTENDNWKHAESEDQNNLLISAFSEILTHANNEESLFKIVHTLGDDALDNSNSPDFQRFHSSLKISTFKEITEVKTFLKENINLYRNTFGVLLFLYSVISTKGLDAVMNENYGADEPLIDYSHGYGSQVLINLLITGSAVAHLFNGNKDIDGMTLYGIPKQSNIGFLTLLEHLGYCEVGSYLKKPENSVWVLGSETHLTVLFSFEKKLAGSESLSDFAHRVFAQFDPEGNNFIPSDKLDSLMEKLDLVSDKDYVNIMRDKLDNEKLGIILLSTFMDEFFPETDRGDIPDIFKVYHYNGQQQSKPDHKVVYDQGQAILLECDISGTMENNPLNNCLQTKWRNIDIQWSPNNNPSMN